MLLSGQCSEKWQVGAHIHSEHALDVGGKHAVKDAARIELSGLSFCAQEIAGVIGHGGCVLFFVEVGDSVGPVGPAATRQCRTGTTNSHGRIVLNVQRRMVLTASRDW